MNHLPPGADFLFFEMSTNQSLVRFIPMPVAGDKTVVVNHSHNFAHETRCEQGRIHVVVGNKEFDLSPEDGNRTVPAWIPHSAWALEDNSLMVCEFLNRDAAGHIITGTSTREAHV